MNKQNWKKNYQDWLNLARKYRKEARKTTKKSRKLLVKYPASRSPLTHNKESNKKEGNDAYNPREADKDWEDICDLLGVNFISNWE